MLPLRFPALLSAICNHLEVIVLAPSNQLVTPVVPRLVRLCIPRPNIAIGKLMIFSQLALSHCITPISNLFVSGPEEQLTILDPGRRQDTGRWGSDLEHVATMPICIENAFVPYDLAIVVFFCLYDMIWEEKLSGDHFL